MRSDSSKWVISAVVILIAVLVVYRFHRGGHPKSTGKAEPIAESAAGSDSSGTGTQERDSAQAGATATASVQAPKEQIRVTLSPKIHLNLSWLSKLPKFIELNPNFANMNERDLKLPKQIRLEYVMDGKCKGSKSVVKGMPGFVDVPLKQDTALGTIIDQVANNPCVIGVGVNNYSSGIIDPTQVAPFPPQQPTTNSPEQVAQEQAQKAFNALNAAAAKGGTPSVGLVATNETLSQQDPQLLTRDPASGYLNSFQGTMDLPDGQVNVKEGTFKVTTGADGSINDSSINNAIMLAANRGWKVIDVDVPDFNPLNHLTAVSYAQSRGATVVTGVPPPKISGLAPTQVPKSPR